MTDPGDFVGRLHRALDASPPYALTKWSARSENFVATRGRLSLNGAPVSGVRLRVDLYGLPAPTDAQGRFVYQADATRLARHALERLRPL